MVMNASRSSRTWTLVGLAALVATVGIYSSRRPRSAPEAMTMSVDADLRDAVAEPAQAPTPAVARIALGRPVPASWFQTPESRHAELDRRLLSSRRRRAYAQSVSVQ
jgi:hypothetical protein